MTTNAYEPMREALTKLLRYFGSPQGVSMAELGRDAYVSLEMKVRIGDLMDAHDALSTLPVNDRHHSGSDSYQADAGAPALSEKVNSADEQEVDVYTRGRITWLSSEDDGPPDCGVTLGLGNGYVLQIGEISKALWERHGGNDMNLGNDYGHWIVLFGPTEAETRLIGRAAADIDADDVLTFLRSLVVPASSEAELTISNDAERDGVSLKPDTSSKPAREAGKLSTDTDAAN